MLEIEFVSAVIQITIVYLSLIAAYLAQDYFSQAKGLLSMGGKLLVFGLFTFAVATFFAYFELINAVFFPLVVEMLYLTSVLFVVAGFKIEVNHLKEGA